MRCALARGTPARVNTLGQVLIREQRSHKLENPYTMGRTHYQPVLPGRARVYPLGGTGSDVPWPDAVSVPDTRCLAHAQGPNPKCHSASTCLRCPCPYLDQGGRTPTACSRLPVSRHACRYLTQAQWLKLSTRVRFP